MASMRRLSFLLAVWGVCFSSAALRGAESPPELGARPLPLGSVHLTGGPLKAAQDLDAKYLLDLEVDRMLAFLRQRAGLEARAQGYGGWDGGRGKQLTGHIAGHYLSGVSYLYAVTGDPRFRERAERVVEELRAVQEARGGGYIGAITDDRGTDGKVLLEQVAAGDIRSGGFDLNGLWSPWYVLHKIFAGLRDAHRHAGIREALEVEVRYAAWAEGILSKLDDAQIQRMLGTEFGGMNEVAVDLHVDTGDRRWLELAEKFHHRAVVDPLARGEDVLPGKHGNTQVPKLLGSLVQHLATGEEIHGRAARFFWDRVALHHSFATGGHGRNEYFGPPDKLSGMVDGRTAETCNVYNMLKLTRTLFALEPEARYAEFHERALFNHVLASMDPESGQVCYMVPVGRGVMREYERNMLDGGFTCCVGTSMESHALHAHGIYFESGDKLWVNLYAPTTAEWKAAGASLSMETGFPDGESAELKLTLAAPRELTLALRRPSWAGEGFSVRVNGEAVRDLPSPGSYVELRRSWRSGDTVALALPKALRLEPLPDNPRRAAILWGPLVLAGDLGPERERRRGRDRGKDATPAPRVPVFAAAERPIAEWLRPVPGKPGHFRTEGVGRPDDVELSPFYRLHRRTYAVYWDLFTPEEWRREEAAHLAAEEKRRRLEAATVAFVQPGEMQPETDHAYKGEGAAVARLEGRAARRGGAWFSLEVPVDPAQRMALVVTYGSVERRRRSFEVLVDGTKVGERTTEGSTPDAEARLVDVEYPIPAEVMAGKTKVTVRFQAAPGSEVGTVCGVRMVRAETEL